MSLSLTKKDKAVLNTTVLKNPYIPIKPFQKQAELLTSKKRDLLYGGGAGGGKTEGLIASALQYVHHEPNHSDNPSPYSAIIFRRTLTDAKKNLIPRAKRWLLREELVDMDIAPHWNANDYVFTFPTGATLRFGYLKTDADIANYDGDEYHFISFDEQTQFTEKQYTDLSARLRKQKGDPIPLRRWNASNPGNIGHTWVRDMYVKGDEYFIPSTYKDNPYIDDVEYEISLNKLDHIRRKQLLDGNWDINPTGGLFKNEWFSKVNQNHLGGRRVISRVRFWDLAGTIPSETNPDPDWTVGLLMWKDNQGDIYIVNVKRFRKSPGAIEDEILNTARNDGANTTVVIEQEGGGASKIAMEYIRKKLAGFTVHTDKPKESKYDRARPVSSHAEHHNIYVLAYDLKGNQYRWVQMSLEEIESFPSPGVHDDVPDAMSGAFKWCNKANTDIDWGWFDAE